MDTGAVASFRVAKEAGHKGSFLFAAACLVYGLQIWSARSFPDFQFSLLTQQSGMLRNTTMKGLLRHTGRFCPPPPPG